MYVLWKAKLGPQVHIFQNPKNTASLKCIHDERQRIIVNNNQTVKIARGIDEHQLFLTMKM